MKKARQEWLEKEIHAQKRWIREHGETLAGYVEHYGSKEDEEHYGDGGEAIYAADTQALARLEASRGPKMDLPKEGVFYHVILNSEMIGNLLAHITYGDAITESIRDEIEHEVRLAIRRGKEMP